MLLNILAAVVLNAPAYLDSWPPEAKREAMRLVAACGEPQAVEEGRLAWYGCAEWKRVEILKSPEPAIFRTAWDSPEELRRDGSSSPSAPSLRENAPGRRR